MATVHRTRPSMGLQHELYRRSHRVHPPGELHPEMLLDMLSMECQRRKLDADVTTGRGGAMDVDSIVNEFKIDDSISACFADLGHTQDSSKEKKTKKTKVESTDTFDTILKASRDTQDKLIDGKAAVKRPGSHESRFRLPTAVKIRLRCGKKVKHCQNDTNKVPYSTMNEQSKEEATQSSAKLFAYQMEGVVSSCGPSLSTVPVSGLPDNDFSQLLNGDTPNFAAGNSSGSADIRLDKHLSEGTPRTVLSPILEEQDLAGCDESPPDRILEFFEALSNESSKDQSLPRGVFTEAELLDWRDECGNTVLHRSVIAGNDRLVAEFAEISNRLLSERNNSGDLPLDTAVQRGNSSCLERLTEVCIENGSPSLPEDELERLITVSIVGDQPKCLSVLLKHYNRKCGKSTFHVDKSNNTPAHVAAKLGRLHCLYELHANNFSLTESNCQGSQPIHFASAHGQRFCFRFLVQLQTEARLVEQVVSRACVIDRLESSLSRFTRELEKDMLMITEHLSHLAESIQGGVAEIIGRIHSACSSMDVRDSESTESCLSSLRTILEICEKLNQSDSFDAFSDVKHLLQRIMSAAGGIEKIQNETQAMDDHVVEEEERKIIIRSIQADIEDSIFKEAEQSTVGSGGNPGGLTESKPLPDLFTHSLRGSCETSSKTMSSETHHDADDESTGSIVSSSEIIRSTFQASHRIHKDTLSISDGNKFSEESSEVEWSSSQSSLSSDSSRKWDKFTCERLQEEPSKMVYGMLLPEVKSRRSSSLAFSETNAGTWRRKHNPNRKRPASLKCQHRHARGESRTINVPNDDLPDEVLMEQRIRQHVLLAAKVKTDLIETITTASGEVFVEDLNQRYHPNFPLNRTTNDNSCRGRRVQYSNDLNANTTGTRIQRESITNGSEKDSSHRKHQNNKPKVNFRNLISKLSKRTKKNDKSIKLFNDPNLDNSKTGENSTKKYSPLEFAERYK